MGEAGPGFLDSETGGLVPSVAVASKGDHEGEDGTPGRRRQPGPGSDQFGQRRVAVYRPGRRWIELCSCYARLASDFTSLLSRVGPTLAVGLFGKPLWLSNLWRAETACGTIVTVSGIAR